VLKLILNSLGIITASYFYSTSVLNGDIVFRHLGIGFLSTAFTCTVYLLLQEFTIRMRSEEIFARKWYGSASGDIFLMLFTCHFIIVSASYAISLFLIDMLRQFSFVALELTDIWSFCICLLFNAAILLIIGVINLQKISKIKISDLFIKIS